jgi:CheY-like chemotaxis protein
MQKTAISLCYHPTATILVDDNKEYLMSLGSSLRQNSNLLCYFYEDPVALLNYLATGYQAIACMVRDENNRSIVPPLDITSIHHDIYNADRFKQIANIIVDYDIPSMNGAQLCEKIKDPFINRIMLTGKADEELAITLFNEAKIDYFALKGTTDLIKKLQTMLDEKQQAFFLRLTEKALNKVAINSWHTLTCLSDPEFTVLFTRLLAQTQAVEYYLLDDQGSFLLLDRYAKPSWLIMANEEKMTSYYQTAKDGAANKKVIAQLKNKIMLPYFPATVTKNAAMRWEDYLYPAKVLAGRKRYYYAHINAPKIHEIQTENILSYQSYIDTTYQEYLHDFLAIA